VVRGARARPGLLAGGPAVRRLFAIALVVLTLRLVAFLLLVRPARAGMALEALDSVTPGDVRCGREGPGSTGLGGAR
jgi:hypothetical protein